MRLYHLSFSVVNKIKSSFKESGGGECFDMMYSQFFLSFKSFFCLFSLILARSARFLPFTPSHKLRRGDQTLLRKGRVCDLNYAGEGWVPTPNSMLILDREYQQNLQTLRS